MQNPRGLPEGITRLDVAPVAPSRHCYYLRMTVSRTASPPSPASFTGPGRAGPAPRDRPAAILLAETIRLIEQDGPLEDQDLLREAFHNANGGEERLLMRAKLLAGRLKLDRELMRWRHAARFSVLLLALLAFLTAYGTAAAVIGSGRTVNAVTAFFALLALPSLTLVIWLLAAISRSGAGLFGYLSFGNILLWMLARLPGERHPQALTMAHAAHRLLQRARLLPWAFGIVSHAVWAAAFLLVLAAVVFAFSFQAYRLTWETTILDPGFFVRFVTLTGTLPSWLGFPLPDMATLRDPSAPGTNQRAWAWWLIGCILVYGLLPRVVLGIASWAAWRRGVRRMHLDTADPYYRKLLVRFEDMEQPVVVDEEHRPPAGERAAPAASASENAAGAVVGFELPAETAWPPQPLPPGLTLVEQIAGSGAERRALLDRLGSLRPRTLLVVCHAASTPDRGTERFLREAARHAGHTALLLEPAGQEHGAQRWNAWLSQSGLADIRCFTDGASAADWMGGALG
ncbi:MAG TPA: DUF2868 domain-containing protein [Noviherbaspirillum sp.]|uniref:DUF2868 domain-containing protein n=1 Tax=Noviherbaspirillum sp. TaxID=1926288 RepID=UPI002D4F5312|nr:DUF2868 domain-containing protein [Noviherbaspirillum sp.]HYD93967.1 DUF2868 domain-containing protein [Noviherbaspirillum sp.]